MTKFAVYIVTNLITAKQYVGITSNFERRWHEHQTDKGRVLYNAIAKYGIENFHISYIANAFDFECACDIERMLIVERNTKAPNGYNLTDGGEGVIGYTHTDETKAKVSAKLKGQKKSEETRQKMSVARKGIVVSKETKTKISEGKKGKISNRKGVKLSEEQKQLMSESQKKRRVREKLCD
jgi:group I intron endonuclease